MPRITVSVRVCRRVRQTGRTQLGRAWYILPQIELPYYFLDFTTLGRPNEDFARNVGSMGIYGSFKAGHGDWS